MRAGVELFVEDGAYTTVASAVSMLVVLALLFSATAAVWSASRAGDVQVAADATALAGENVVSSYHTAFTVIDASLLSMGLAGFAMTGTGLVGMLIPGVNAAAAETVDAGIRMLKTRNDFAASASKGLKRLEDSLPYLIAAHATAVSSAQSTDVSSFTGTALAVPRTSASDFPALAGPQIETGSLETAASELDEASRELARAAEETAAAKERAWLADCGREGRNMQERAGRLSGLSDADNPDYASSITWKPEVALDRARAYYRWRLEHDGPENGSVEAKADSAARRAFYRYALQSLERAEIREDGEGASSTVELLPKNTDEVRGSSLYTEAAWPSTVEDGAFVLHYGADCPGARGPAGPALPLAAVEDGSARECPACRFGVGDVGKAPAASTSIDNGFEYHLRAFTLALDGYIDARNRELELERRARHEAEAASGAFDEALAALSGARPRIAPPGRYGCVALVTMDGAEVPDGLESPFAKVSDLGRRGAVSAAVLAPEPATGDANVLASFFSSLEARGGGGGAVGLIDDVMDVWGRLLVAYGDMGEGLSELLDELLGGLDAQGGGPISTWLGDAVEGAMRGLGLEAVDLSLRKPVLTDSAHVLAHAEGGALADVQQALRSLPAGVTDPAALLQAVGYEAGEYMASLEFVIAEIPLPGGRSIPLTIRLRDVLGMGGGDGP